MNGHDPSERLDRLDRPRASQAEQLRALWRMTPLERESAMWRGELTFRQLQHWTARAPHEVPLLAGELAWIAMRTSEWAEASSPTPVSTAEPSS